MHQECQQPQGLLMSHDTTPGQTQTDGIASIPLTEDSHLAELAVDVEVLRSLAVVVEDGAPAGAGEL